MASARLLVAGGEDDARALLRQPDRGDLADAGGGAGDDDGFAMSSRMRKRLRAERQEPLYTCKGRGTFANRH